MYRRTLLAAAIPFALVPALAMADETIAGQWQANLGDGVMISMDVLADGYWTSQTIQNDKVVATMAGRYEQTRRNASAGVLVFKPSQSHSHASEAHGAPKVETDRYTLRDHGTVLQLVTQHAGAPESGDTMIFHKQPYAKD